ncbi:hypothetical protein GCM10012286_36450 [Streptomyces lasiicapitis]|uniref:Uncharacterized protein n=1 Tax=Streptomyces lasiicapitis TaxID=1923961 RepID=A0ABQ2M2Q6_9ACTN|nr:hypothetical protein GCM10012286_36450 [Streptomyces lasiicapitis]
MAGSTAALSGNTWSPGRAWTRAAGAVLDAGADSAEGVAGAPEAGAVAPAVSVSPASTATAADAAGSARRRDVRCGRLDVDVGFIGWFLFSADSLPTGRSPPRYVGSQQIPPVVSDRLVEGL